jgi:hypothetical protein
MRSEYGFVNDLRETRDVTAEVGQPTLIIATRNDGAVPFAHAEALATGIRDSELIVSEADSHLIWLSSDYPTIVEIFSKEAPDLLWAIARDLRSFGGLPGTLVTDREGALHAGGGKPTEPYAAFCGAISVGWRFCEAGDPEAKGVVERLNQFLETSFEPGRQFAGPLDFQEQLDGWFARRANVRTHRALRERPLDRLAEERASLRALPERTPDIHRRVVLRVPPQPYVRVDTND